MHYTEIYLGGIGWSDSTNIWMHCNATPDSPDSIDYALDMDLCHERGILAMRIQEANEFFQNLIKTSKLDNIDFSAIDALALQPTQHPDPWRLTIVINSSDVSAMRELSPVLKSRMPLLQSAGRLVMKWIPRREGRYAFEVWDDEAASE